MVDGNGIPLSVVVDGANRHEALGQRTPLAAGAQQIEDGRHRLAVVHTRPALFYLRFLGRQHGLDLRPEGIGDLVVRADAIVGLFHLLWGRNGGKLKESARKLRLFG